MGKITWSTKGYELLQPHGIKHPAPYQPQEGVWINVAYSLARWGSDMEIIDMDTNEDFPEGANQTPNPQNGDSSAREPAMSSDNYKPSLRN